MSNQEVIKFNSKIETAVVAIGTKLSEDHLLN